MSHTESTARVLGLRGAAFLSALGAVASIAFSVPAFAQTPPQNPPAPAAAAPVPSTVGTGGAATSEASFDRLISAELGRPGGLTSQTAASRAKETSPALRQRREELRAAAADVDRALAAYYPRLSVEAQYTRLSDVGDSQLGSLVAAPTAGPGPIPPGSPLVNVPLEFPQILNQYSLSANLVLPVSDYFLKVAPSHRAAKLARESTAQNLEVGKLDADAEARYAYYDWVRARLGAVVAEQALEQTRAHLNDLKALVEAGTASRADLLRVESQTAHAELVAVKSQHLSQLAEDHLRTLLHDPPTQSYVIGESFDAAPSTERQVPKLTELLRIAEAQRPEFRALEKAEQARRAEASAERGSYAPRVDLFAGATYANPNSRIFPQEEEWEATWQAGAKLSITLSDIPGTSARARSIDARAAALVAQRSLLADGVRSQVLQAAQAADEAELALSTTERGLLAAEESYRVRKLLFANGRATTVEVLDAETDLTQARYEAVGARIDRGVARAQLARALGKVGR